MNADLTRREFSQLALLGAGASAARLATGDAEDSRGVASAYSPVEGKWNIEWPGRLSQHDLVYLSPPEDPMLGLPIGNGDLGALLWTTESQVVLAINKCDTWDDNEPRPFQNWGAHEEENHTALRHCGRLVVDFGCPAFDLLYLRDFEARLDLAGATATARSVTAFSEVSLSAYASAGHRVIVVRCERAGPEPYQTDITLERWGSRTFAHWYSQVNRDASRGLAGTRARIERNRIVIEQKLRTLSFAIAAEVVPDSGSAQARRAHSRAGRVTLAGTERRGFTVFVTAVTSENDPDPVAAAHRLLDRAAADREPAIGEAHRNEWRKFWSASMVDLPEKYLENIWHVNLYLANSSSRGAYPPHFCNGIWGWNRDFVPWNYYFHWNMQCYAWPLAAANHAGLALPYYRLRAIQLRHAMEYASRRLGKPGAFYADVSDRRGFNDVQVNHNQTPGAQIALGFWRHYEFTNDRTFLEEMAWPVIREVTRFYSACLAEGGDGLYHISGTSAYEGSPLFDDCITDLAMVRGLFPVAVRVARMFNHDAAETGVWQRQLARLAPFRLASLGDFEFETKSDTAVHKGGLKPGAPLESRQVFAVGRNKKGEWVRNRYAGRPEMAYYGIPDPEIAPVFPAGVIGLAERGSDLFRAAVTQLRLHPPAAPDPNRCAAGTMAGSGELCMGWCPYPIALARLGMAEELAAELIHSVSTWQFYPQGFGHYGPYYVFKPDAEQRWRRNMVRDAATVARGREPAKFEFPSWPFRHFDNEAMPIVCCAINEMLIQSHDGTIRIFPAVPKDWEVRFDLAAAGGFRVSAERREGAAAWVAVESVSGGRCRLAHPWPGGQVVCTDVTSGSEVVRLAEETSGADRILAWDSVAGRRYLLARSADAIANWSVRRLGPSPATAPRRLQNATLGRERLY